MKRIIICIFLTFLFIISADATTIKSKNISGPTTTKMGETITVSFSINFNGLDKNTLDTKGIWLVAFDLNFDEDFYSIASITSPGWTSGVYKENNEYMVVSFPDEDYPNKCLDGYLNCGNYNVKIKFYVKDSDLSASTIEMGETGVGVFKLKEDPNEYQTEDMIELEDKNKESLEILIKEDKDVVIKEPENIVQEESPNIAQIKVVTPVTTKKVTPKTTTTTKQDIKTTSNTYLKSLEIDGYKIKFKKYYVDYIIYIDENINTLKVNATPEDENATVNITGADNLKDNEYKVKIEVKNDNDETRTYVINARFKEENKTLKKLKNTLVENKTLLYIASGAIVVIILIIIFLKTSYNRKLDKALDKF